MGVSLDVKLNGPLFTKNVSKAVEDAILAEVIVKVDERLERSSRTIKSKGRPLIGQQRNTVTRSRRELEIEATSTLIHPRNKGTSWVKKHLGAPGFGKGIIGAMVPNVVRAAGKRIAGDLG